MIYSKIEELKGLVDEYQWQEGSLLVIVLGFNLKDFIEIIENTFEDSYIENAIVYKDGSIGFTDFQDTLEYLDLDPKDIFPKED